MVIILLKITFIWSVLISFYFLLLQGENNSTKNRYYLWCSLILGLFIPFFNFPFHWQLTNVSPLLYQTNYNQLAVQIASESKIEQATTQPESTFTWSKSLFWIWLCGAIVKLYFLIKSYLQLWWLSSVATKHKHHVSKYYTHSSIIVPYSFGSLTFLVDEILKNAKIVNPKKYKLKDDYYSIHAVGAFQTLHFKAVAFTT